MNTEYNKGRTVKDLYEDYYESREDWRGIDSYEDFYLPQEYYDWCIIQRCRYSDPKLVSCRLPTKDSITVTEYGFGEYTYSISLDKVLLFGNKQDLRDKLVAFEEILLLSEKVKNSLKGE